MSFKGFNVAIHELGHNVEQVFSLQCVDQTLLSSVPNTAFTEAIAFVFQSRAHRLLDSSYEEVEAEHSQALRAFWHTYEIAGPAMVDIAAWHWMYEHPDATPSELRDAVVHLSKDVWNRYYAPVFQYRDVVLLGIYSHMVNLLMYLPDYPLGHIIELQIEEHLRKQGLDFGAEVERMTSFGSVLPDLWMEHATGSTVSSEPLLGATERALNVMA
jgi:oligoendopeptidase F